MTRENSDNDRNLNETVVQPDALNETIVQSRANDDALNETIVGEKPFDAEAIAAPRRANSLLIKIKDATSYSQISEVCLYYENNWTPERKFSIQDALNYLPPDLRREAFKELVCIDISLGVSNNSSIAIPKYKAEFPSWTKEIDEAYQAAMSDSAVRYQSRIGRKLGNLRLEEMIGKGGMGVVYKAFNELLRRYEAVKYLAPTNDGREQSLDFIRLELATNGQVKDPRFARAYDAGTDGHFYYLAMEYVDGVDLAKYLRNERGDREKSGPIPIEEAARYVCEVAKGLVSIHRKGIIHRDIKPENIMLDEDGEIRVLDLGLAKWNRAADDEKNVDVEGAIVGTPAYMSPEAFSAPELVDERSDIYCLGGVFFFLITGKLPVKRFNPRVDQSPKPLGEFFPSFEQNTRRSRSGARFAPGDSIRDKFLRVLEKMLEPDRDKRYKSASKVVDDLEKVLAEAREIDDNLAFENETDGEIDSESVSLASVVYDDSEGVGESLVSIGAGSLNKRAFNAFDYPFESGNVGSDVLSNNRSLGSLSVKETGNKNKGKSDKPRFHRKLVVLGALLLLTAIVGLVLQRTSTKPTWSTKNASQFEFRTRPCEGGAEIIGIMGKCPNALVIPNTVVIKSDEGRYTEEPVVKIGFGVFLYKHSLTSITLPEGLTTIGDNAFEGCDSLTSIALPEGLTCLGDRAFNECISLTTIALPDSLTKIGSRTFSGCRALSSIALPEELSTIGEGSFFDCRSLTSITLPEGLTYLGDRSFYGCRSLTMVALPDGLTKIGDSAFSNCGLLKTVTFPDGLTQIGYHAFDGCKNLKSVALPASVTSVDPYAFPSSTEVVRQGE